MGYEPETMGLFLARAREARGFADVGANSGVFSLAAIAVNPGLDVHCFEPVAYVAQALRVNLELNDFSAAVYERAVSDTTGVVNFSVSDDHPAIGHIATEAEVGEWRHESLPTVTLDEALAGVQIDLIKIDVEGFEAAALRGGAKLFERCRPVLFLEVLPWRDEDPEPLLARFGYRSRQITGNGLSGVNGFSDLDAGVARNFLCEPA